MITTKQHAKAGTTEYQAVYLVDVPEDYPKVVGREDRLTRASALALCEEAMLSGRATMAEVYEVQYEAIEYTDSHYGRIRDAEDRRITSQFGWLSDGGRVEWDPPQPAEYAG